MKKCSYCRSEIPDQPAIASASSTALTATKRSTANDFVCEKCKKNEEKYGKPSICTYCQLPAAFLGGRCVHCSYSERKHGTPVACCNCKLTAAFPKDPSLRNKPLLCRLCLISYSRTVKKATAAKVAGPATAASNNKTSGVVLGKRRVSSEDKQPTTSKSLKRSESLADPSISAEHILLVQQLKDEIAELQKKLAQKDLVVMERDKKVDVERPHETIATLNAEAMRKEKESRAKIVELQKQHSTNTVTLQEQIRSLGKQLAQNSRGRKQDA